MSFAILSFYNSRYSPIGDTTSSVSLEYCQRWGRDFIHSMDEALYGDRSPLWAKVNLIKRNLKNYEWVLWIDSDAMIMDFSVDLFSYIDDRYDIVLAEEDLPEGKTINTGVMWVKNSRNSDLILDLIWAQTQCLDHCWAEQAGLIDVIKKDPEIGERIKRIPKDPINVYPRDLNDNTQIVHLAGGPSNVSSKAATLSYLETKIKK